MDSFDLPEWMFSNVYDSTGYKLFFYRNTNIIKIIIILSEWARFLSLTSKTPLRETLHLTTFLTNQRLRVHWARFRTAITGGENVDLAGKSWRKEGKSAQTRKTFLHQYILVCSHKLNIKLNTILETFDFKILLIMFSMKCRNKNKYWKTRKWYVILINIILLLPIGS